MAILVILALVLKLFVLTSAAFQAFGIAASIVVLLAMGAATVLCVLLMDTD
jgi:hypothetical protein